MDVANEIHSTLTGDLLLYILEDQNLQSVVADSASTSTEIISAAGTYITATETLVDSLSLYTNFMTEYSVRLTPAATLGIFKNQVTEFPNPLLASQLTTAVTDCETAITDCTASVDEIARQACLHDALNLNCTANAAGIGASAVYTAGESNITGRAMKSVPMTLTETGVIVTDETLIGIFFNYCASSGGSCALASREVSPDASGYATTSLPTGSSGTLSVHIYGCAPIVVPSISIGDEGMDIDITCMPTDIATAEEVISATEDASATVAGAFIDPTSGTCDKITQILVDPNPTNPIPLEDVLMTITVFPAAGDCNVSYSVIGSDNYTLSGELATDARGIITFSIDGGEEGVVDNVSITTNDLITLIAYAF